MVAETTRECTCWLPLDPPADQRFWWPSRDPEPPSDVTIVALYMQNPAVLRMERRDMGDGRTGWKVLGAAASHHEVTPPEEWATVGICWRKIEHPVVQVVPEAEGA